jgi:hypothetical protein
VAVARAGHVMAPNGCLRDPSIWDDGRSRDPTLEAPRAPAIGSIAEGGDVEPCVARVAADRRVQSEIGRFAQVSSRVTAAKVGLLRPLAVEAIC